MTTRQDNKDLEIEGLRARVAELEKKLANAPIEVWAKQIREEEREACIEDISNASDDIPAQDIIRARGRHG